MTKLEKAIANLQSRTLSENVECNECRAEFEDTLELLKKYHKLCECIQTLCCKRLCNDCVFSTDDYDCQIYDFIEGS